MKRKRTWRYKWSKGMRRMKNSQEVELERERQRVRDREK